MINTRTNEKQPLLSTGKQSFSLWKGKSLAKRLNILGTITCILDTTINLASSRSHSINHFFESTVPYYVSATYYLLPSTSLLLYYVKNCCINGCRQYDDEHVDDREIKANKLIDTLSEVDGFSEYLMQYPKVKDEMLEKIKSMQNVGYLDRIDTFINIVYFTLRALHGAVLIFKAYDITTKQTNDAVNDWSDFISNVINTAYLMTMLIHNNFQKQNISKNPHCKFAREIKLPHENLDEEQKLSHQYTYNS